MIFIYFLLSAGIGGYLSLLGIGLGEVWAISVTGAFILHQLRKNNRMQEDRDETSHDEEENQAEYE